MRGRNLVRDLRGRAAICGARALESQRRLACLTCGSFATASATASGTGPSTSIKRDGVLPRRAAAQVEGGDVDPARRPSSVPSRPMKPGLSRLVT